VILYADTSALVKMVLTEEGTAQANAVTGQADEIYSVNVAYAELRAAVSAAIRDQRVALHQRDSVMGLVVNVWDKVFPVGVDWSLVLEAGNLAERHSLRGYDAIHLSALMRVGNPDIVTVACWDYDLRRAAASMGYPLFP